MENNNNERQIDKDLQEITHLANALKSLANVIGIRVDDIIVRQSKRKRNGDGDEEKKEEGKE